MNIEDPEKIKLLGNKNLIKNKIKKIKTLFSSVGSCKTKRFSAGVSLVCLLSWRMTSVRGLPLCPTGIDCQKKKG